MHVLCRLMVRQQTVSDVQKLYGLIDDRSLSFIVCVNPLAATHFSPLFFLAVRDGPPCSASWSTCHGVGQWPLPKIRLWALVGNAPVGTSPCSMQ